MAEELEFGIQQYKAGNKEEARRIFLNVIKENPNYVRAYMWLYNVAYNDGERHRILKKVLDINPTYDEAHRLLAELQQKEKSENPKPKPHRVPPLPPEKPKNNNLLIGIGSAIVIVICCMCAALALNGTEGTTAANPFVFGYEIKYVVSGTGRTAFVTYFNETGGTEQINANMPWTKTMSVDSGAPLSLFAQNDGAGTITCEIWVNGEKRKTSTSTAQYGVVTCSDFAY